MKNWLIFWLDSARAAHTSHYLIVIVILAVHVRKAFLSG